MDRNVTSLALLARVKAGEPAAVARLISRAEGGQAEARPALAEIYKQAGQAHVVGITGVPGSGKSSLVAKLAELLRARGGKVGIIAVDPSSPYSGGAILGDRIRMGDLASDPDIYIRSMASRGAGGGMARATLDAIDILDVAGFSTVIVETVGVGQDEVDIARASHTTIVVSAPGLGDEIQAIKAGILEIADIHVVSKCDKPEASSAIADLRHMRGHKSARDGAEWNVPVIGTSVISGQGLKDLADAIATHRHVAFESEGGWRRRAAIAHFRLRKTAENLLMERFAEAFKQHAAPYEDALHRRENDPYSLATTLLDAAFPLSRSQ